MNDEFYAIDSDELCRLTKLLFAYAEQQNMEHSKLAFMINVISVKMGEELGLKITEIDRIENVQ